MLLGILVLQNPVVRAAESGAPGTNPPSGSGGNAVAGTAFTNATASSANEPKADPKTVSLPLIIEAARMLKADPNPNPWALKALFDVQKAIPAMGGTVPTEAIPGSEIKGWTRSQLYLRVKKDLEQAIEALAPGDPGSEDLIAAIDHMDKAVFLCGP